MTTATNTSLPTTSARPQSKSAAVIKLLTRARGATITEIQTATSWQPHSVRAFLSGLRKAGRTLGKEERKSGETSYRLVAEAVHTPDATPEPNFIGDSAVIDKAVVDTTTANTVAEPSA
jgi:hypothetical protein